MTQVIPPPAAPSAPSMLLRRSTSDRLIGGVCGGLGRRYGIDPVVLRVLFVVAVFASGVGLLAYLALWLLLPQDTDPAPDPLTRNVLALVVGLLVAFGALMAVFGWLGSLGAFTGVLVAALLVGIVVWLLQQDKSARPASAAMSTAAPAGPASPPSPEWTPPTGFAYGGTGIPTPPPVPPAGGPYPPAPPRERSLLGLYTLLAALIVGAGLTAAAAAGIGSIGIVTVLAATLGVLAVGLLVGAVRGRARWLIALAIPLALTLAAVAHVAPVLSSNVPASVGQRVWTPTEAGSYELGIGDATLDLTQWARRPAAAQPNGETVSADLGVGELRVLVPRSWEVTVVADLGVGSVRVNGEQVATDPGEEATLQLPATGTPTGELRLELDARVGDIAIEQRAVTAPAELQDRTPDLNDGTTARTTPSTKENAR